MKKSIFVLLAGAMLTISSCSKEGAVGPQGPQGPAGTNASTAFQLTFTVNPQDWVSYGTSGSPGAGIGFQYNNQNLSFASVGQGAVLVYQNINTTAGNSYVQLPYTNYSSSGQISFKPFWVDGALYLQDTKLDWTFDSWSSALNFTVVVIPGTKDLPVGVNRSDYNSIVNYYHPKTVK